MAMRFHLLHGSAITLSAGQSCATRSTDTYHNGLVFSAQPLCVNERIGLQLGTMQDWAGALRVGVTSIDPATLLTSSDDHLQSQAHPELVRKEGFWVRVIPEKLLSHPRCLLVLNLTSLGQLQLFIDGHHKGALLLGLPTKRRLWLLLDIYGNTNSATFIATEVGQQQNSVGHYRGRTVKEQCRSMQRKDSNKTVSVITEAYWGGETVVANRQHYWGRETVLADRQHYWRREPVLADRHHYWRRETVVADIQHYRGRETVIADSQNYWGRETVPVDRQAYWGRIAIPVGSQDDWGRFINWFLYIVSPQQGDLRLWGLPPGRGGVARACNRRVRADSKADSLDTVPPTPLLGKNSSTCVQSGIQEKGRNNCGQTGMLEKSRSTCGQTGILRKRVEVPVGRQEYGGRVEVPVGRQEHWGRVEVLVGRQE
ncbi:protein neuralized [Plakobranchus ocellatus]|uniref:Protein neuralized n=1 Tax=Plakobranchus ocellatus TaxID=259542 RepID=A0AAV3Z851_9GAST|nr:protein neuralized [Plakobranchus ocellatus]